MAFELANRLREPARDPLQLAQLLVEPHVRLLAVHPLQCAALAIDDVLESPLDFAERLLEIELAVALAHLLAQLFEKFLQARHARAVEVHPLPRHPVHRLAHVVGVGEKLGQLFERMAA